MTHAEASNTFTYADAAIVCSKSCLPCPYMCWDCIACLTMSNSQTSNPQNGILCGLRYLTKVVGCNDKTGRQQRDQPSTVSSHVFSHVSCHVVYYICFDFDARNPYTAAPSNHLCHPLTQLPALLSHIFAPEKHSPTKAPPHTTLLNRYKGPHHISRHESSPLSGVSIGHSRWDAVHYSPIF